MKKKRVLLNWSYVWQAIVLVIALLLGGCSTPGAGEELSMTELYFDTVVQIHVWGAKRSVLDHCKELCSYYEGLFSKEIDTSDIARINAAQGAPTHVSGETAELIRKGLYYSELTEGKFDITIAPLTSLWDFHNHTEGNIPSEQELENARSLVDYRNVLVEGSTVTLLVPGMEIDLGGIAKGYIADRLKEYLVSEGIKHAYINLGGNVLLIGNRYDKTDYRIGIQRPFDESGQIITSVEVSDCSVVSSGIYQRYFEKDGKLYHHILNPETGYPYENNLLQVTILSDSSADGDALSTCCYILGLEKGMELVESLENVQAIFITDDYGIHTAGNYQARD